MLPTDYVKALLVGKFFFFLCLTTCSVTKPLKCMSRVLSVSDRGETEKGYERIKQHFHDNNVLFCT